MIKDLLTLMKMMIFMYSFKLSFQYSYFNPQKITSILQKASNRRDDEELARLYLIIKNNALFVEFFKEMPHETSLNLLRSFRFQKYEKGQEVFKYGSFLFQNSHVSYQK